MPRKRGRTGGREEGGGRWYEGREEEWGGERGNRGIEL